MQFTIGDPTQFTFSIEVDENGKLTELTASNRETTYDCKIQLTSRVDPESIACCDPFGCVQGSCS